MGWRLYNTKTHKKVEIDTQVFDPQIVALYDPKTHRLVEKFDWDPDNFETRGELEAFLTEFPPARMTLLSDIAIGDEASRLEDSAM